MLRRIQDTSSGGITPSRYMEREAPGPHVPMATQIAEARMLPIGYPHCKNAPPLPRALSGQSSAVIEAPVAHSEPIASPTRKRSTAKDSQSQENALKPVSSE